jgi:Derlin-2/3
MLEEGSFRSRTADFVWMLLLGAIGMMVSFDCTHSDDEKMVEPLVHMPFLGSSLTFMMVYVWSKRNPDVRLNFLGFMNFTGPYLPWVLLGFSLLINNSFPMHDALGIAFGHVYYFFDDIYPVVSGTGIHYLRAPAFVYAP